MIRISVPFHGSVPTNRTLSSTGPLSVQLKRSYRLHARIKAGITQQRYQRVHSNTAIVLNFADFPKNPSFKSYGVIRLPRAAPAS